MAKASSSWALRFKAPLDYPNIAKFSDELNWDQAQKPVRMYFKEEELKEEELPTVERDSEYYRRKRERRRAYRKKNTLVLEDSSDNSGENSGFRFEGKLCNLGLADVEEAKSKASKPEDAPFRYVLLQFVKKDVSDGSGATTSEVNVIPVGDTFSFKKAYKVPDELLADIDERFIEEMQRSKENISRYKGISKSLTSAERARMGLADTDDGGKGGRGHGLDAKEFLGGFGTSALFGASVNKAFGKGRKGMEGGESVERGFLNENGLDVDVLKSEDNLASGDYSTRFVDDEEEFVTVEQNRNQVMAESELNAAQRYSADLDEDDSSAGESTEDEEEAERARARGQDEDERGMVDETMLSGAAQARKLFVSRSSGGRIGSSAALASADRERAPPVAVKTEATGSGATVPVKSALKRSWDEASSGDLAAVKEEGAVGGAKVAKVSFEQAGAAASPVAPVPAAGGPAATTAGTGTQPVEYPLTEQGFRLFMRHRGGKVLPSDMNYFKPQLKACDKATKKRFYDIVVNITMEVEDPLLGKVLTLKS